VVQSIQAPNQTIDREFACATGRKRGNVRLPEPEYGGRLGLGKLAAFDNPADFANELGIEGFFFRVGKTEGGKYIAATHLYARRNQSHGSEVVSIVAGACAVSLLFIERLFNWSSQSC
jgi:hypothetical protein